MTFCARVGLLFQMITVYPLLTYIIRVQLFTMLYKKTYPGLVNLILRLLFYAKCCYYLLCMLIWMSDGYIRYFNTAMGLEIQDIHRMNIAINDPVTAPNLLSNIHCDRLTLQEQNLHTLL